MGIVPQRVALLRVIQPDIDAARESLVAQRVLWVSESFRGVLDDVHRVLGRRAAEEALAILCCRPCATGGSACSARGATIRSRLRRAGAP